MTLLAGLVTSVRHLRCALSGHDGYFIKAHVTQYQFQLCEGNVNRDSSVSKAAFQFPNTIQVDEVAVIPVLIQQ